MQVTRFIINYFPVCGNSFIAGNVPLIADGDPAIEAPSRSLRQRFQRYFKLSYRHGESRSYKRKKRGIIQGVELALRHRDEQGMWHAYIDRQEYGVDTSATAGIAASIAWGVKQGLLDAGCLSIAEKAYRGLLDYVSPDGFLRGVSQINRGGEALQRSRYRVMAQFGMGLMAQLKAALMYRG
jgi:rhamnogalacturonyl hydrolase YesR